MLVVWALESRLQGEWSWPQGSFRTDRFTGGQREAKTRFLHFCTIFLYKYSSLFLITVVNKSLRAVVVVVCSWE
jgi:hypothetical protein